MCWTTNVICLTSSFLTQKWNMPHVIHKTPHSPPLSLWKKNHSSVGISPRMREVFPPYTHAYNFLRVWFRWRSAFSKRERCWVRWVCCCWSSRNSYDSNKFNFIILINKQKKSREMATSNGERYKARKPRGLVARAWSENCEEVEVPGSPKTPRTSTTPGIKRGFCGW